MGPLINVLLLIFFAETFAMSVLYFKTGNSIAYTFEWTMALGVRSSVDQWDRDRFDCSVS